MSCPVSSKRTPISDSSTVCRGRRGPSLPCYGPADRAIVATARVHHLRLHLITIIASNLVPVVNSRVDKRCKTLKRQPRLFLLGRYPSGESPFVWSSQDWSSRLWIHQKPLRPRPFRGGTIQGVIAAGVTASAVTISTVATTRFCSRHCPSVERLITLNVNGQQRPVDDEAGTWR
jgi:hypothetical protein